MACDARFRRGDRPYRGDRIRHASRVARVGLIACLLLAVSSRSPLRADESYSYELDAKGNPVFTQVIRWDAVEFAEKYRLEIVDAVGTALVDDTAATTERTAHLGAGEYRYRISVFNLLGKCEYSGPWVIMRVLKAERPAIASISPGTIYAGDEAQLLEVSGERLLASSRVAVIDRETGAVACAAIVRDASKPGASMPDAHGDTTLVVEIPALALAAGEYRLAVENPGGLRAESDDWFRVRERRESRASRGSREGGASVGGGAAVAGDADGSVRAARKIPLAYSASVGWSPEVALSDAWYEGVFGGRLYPAAVSADVSCAYAKYLPVSFGARVDASFSAGSLAVGDIALRSDRRLAGVSAFASYALTPSLTALAGIGGALAWTLVSVDAGTSDALEVATVDPAFRAYAETRYAFFKGAYAGAGAAYERIAYSDASAGIIIPRLFAGWAF